MPSESPVLSTARWVARDVAVAVALVFIIGLTGTAFSRRSADDADVWGVWRSFWDQAPIWIFMVAFLTLIASVVFRLLVRFQAPPWVSGALAAGVGVIVGSAAGSGAEGAAGVFGALGALAGVGVFLLARLLPGRDL